MTTMKTLMLAGFAALSLGVASANAQSLTPSAGEGDYYRAHNSVTGASTNQDAGQVQSGSSDVEQTHSGGGVPVHSDHGTIANPG